MAGKPGGAIVTCAVPGNNKMPPPVCDMGVNAIMFYMMEEGMNFVGAVKVFGNVPALNVDMVTSAKMTGVKMIYGPNATVESVGINKFEDQWMP